jgi:hypothetical protein
VGMQICHRTNGCHLYLDLENASKRLEAYIKAGKALHSTMLQFCPHHGAHPMPPPRSRGRGRGAEDGGRGRGRGGSSSFDFYALGDSPCVFFPRGRCRHAVPGATCPRAHVGEAPKIRCMLPISGGMCSNGPTCLYYHSATVSDDL